MEDGAGENYFRAHGLGNDYLVFPSGGAWPLTPAAIQEVCHRGRGLGSDGVVLELPPREGVFRLRMFNPDGSEFERSGNGLRIFAASLATVGRVGREPFLVEVGGGRVMMQVLGKAAGGTLDVKVEMGQASFHPDDVGMVTSLLEGWAGGVAGPPAEAGAALPGSGGALLHLQDGPVPIRGVSVGNPHCVVFTEDLSGAALRRLGPFLASHPVFPRGANVQLARRTGENRVRIAIWERGVGRTPASGTSSCAVAAAAVLEGRVTPGAVTVEMDGGTLEVGVTPDLEITLRGPVQEVSRGTLAPGYLEWLRERG